MLGIKTRLIKRKFRKQNKHNFTNIKNCVDISKIKVGKGTYGTIDAKIYRKDSCNLFIGNYCSIAENVIFLLGGEHDYKNISTYPFKAKFFNQPESKDNGDIVVQDDVWIGYGCTILSGVTIGQGAVIGAGSIVAKNIPPYAIFCGNKVIKYRFSEEIRERLLKIDFSKIDDNFIKNNYELLYTKVSENTINEIINKLN